MDSTCSAEKQGPPHEETLKNLKKLVIFTEKLEKEKEKEMEMEMEYVEEECKTPTCPGNKIPSPLKCPPPPKKKPSTPPAPAASERRTSFYQVTPEEIEEFFRVVSIPNESLPARVNNNNGA